MGFEMITGFTEGSLLQVTITVLLIYKLQGHGHTKENGNHNLE
jgi:hypothetical protein